MPQGEAEAALFLPQGKASASRHTSLTQTNGNPSTYITGVTDFCATQTTNGLLYITHCYHAMHGKQSCIQPMVVTDSNNLHSNNT